MGFCVLCFSHKKGFNVNTNSRCCLVAIVTAADEIKLHHFDMRDAHAGIDIPHAHQDSRYT